MKTIATMTAVLALGATPVLAGSLEETPVTPAPVATPLPAAAPSLWAGPYIGAQVGYGWGELDGDDGDGAIGGLNAGYLANSGRFVYGAEADYDFTDIPFDNSSSDIDGIGRLKLKAGYDLGRTLIYATGGAAYANADIDKKSHADWGWTGGAGVSYLVTDNVSLGAEVLYNKFDDFDGTGSDIEATTATARVAYRF